MADVRLTATNPEDSSVVPVACNSKGELLIEEVKVEAVENNLQVFGDFTCATPLDVADRWRWKMFSDDGDFTLYDSTNTRTVWGLYGDGHQVLRSYGDAGTGKVDFCFEAYAHRVENQSGTQVFRVNWDGSSRLNKLELATEADKSEHYSSVKNAETGEETNEYIGPVIDVGAELQFLRAQVRALMEKLKMAPEEGWPVWDGSTET